MRASGAASGAQQSEQQPQPPTPAQPSPPALQAPPDAVDPPALQLPPDAAESLSPAQRDARIHMVRKSLLDNQETAVELRTALKALTSIGASSRAAYLQTLQEQIGPPPARTWQEEWHAINVERLLLLGNDKEDLPSYPSIEDMLRMASGNISLCVSEGQWEREQAECFWCLQAESAPISKALSEGSARYAASTYAFSGALFSVVQARSRTLPTPAQLPPPTYYPLRGKYSLCARDANWDRLEEPDVNGFCGLTSSAPVKTTGIAAHFTPSGLGVNIKVDGCSQLKVQDSPVVMFESALPDDHGMHAPVTILPGEFECHFPPNTLFRLVRTEEDGFDAPGGVRVRQRLLVVRATYREPMAGSGGVDAPSKLCGYPVTLKYGDRQAYINGLGDIVSHAVLSMQQEFERDISWTDWMGEKYDLRTEFAYVAGPAVRVEGRTPGTRDAFNDGKRPEEFLETVNAHILSRRAQGLGTSLPEKYAFFSLDEVMAVRLYSGPAFIPINAFLRQIGSLAGEMRLQMAQHVALTFAATVGMRTRPMPIVRHAAVPSAQQLLAPVPTAPVLLAGPVFPRPCSGLLCSAIRKLSAVATPEESAAPLYRGVRGQLSDDFWRADPQGIVAATELGFMSTSRNRRTPIHYMAEGTPNVLWALRPKPQSDGAYHHGADISMLSQFAGEDEVLFPPCTMLIYHVLRGTKAHSVEQRSEDGRKTFLNVDVEPHFV
eukprot:CAMPEP_0115837498 /NCGR_PEP_ID=MMETSP0287-20121206/5250_1 /TAXON_ID=412157 /ORGANISM="Chrysochromulina rotalis, Strain UIO044" /LENGTH=718 /DNA_ID=CAMNT_0003291007 /DNA_START=17 /DNA_END=2173 /DNA_ORIENTATION=+